VERRLESQIEERRRAVSMADRNYERRMIVEMRGNIWASGERNGGRLLEAQQKVYLKVRGMRRKSNQHEGTMTSKKFQFRGLKMFSYQGGVSELHAWRADRMTLSQPGSQQERAEKRPHGAKSMKSRGGGRTSRIGRRRLIYSVGPFSPSQFSPHCEHSSRSLRGFWLTAQALIKLRVCGI